MPTAKDMLHHLQATLGQLDTFLKGTPALDTDSRTTARTFVRGAYLDARALEHEHRTMDDQLTALNELVRISALLTASLDIETVLNEVIDTIIALAGAERVYLMLNDSNGQLKMHKARNWDQENLKPHEVELSQGVVELTLADRLPIVTTNAQLDARFENRASVVTQQLRSILCIPLILQDEILGVLYADNKLQQGLFTQERIPLLVAFAHQAAIAIVNARRYQTVQQEVERLRIQIDQHQIDAHVKEITETGYFQELETKAEQMRQQFET